MVAKHHGERCLPAICFSRRLRNLSKMKAAPDCVRFTPLGGFADDADFHEGELFHLASQDVGFGTKPHSSNHSVNACVSGLGVNCVQSGTVADGASGPKHLGRHARRVLIYCHCDTTVSAQDCGQSEKRAMRTSEPQAFRRMGPDPWQAIGRRCAALRRALCLPHFGPGEKLIPVKGTQHVKRLYLRHLCCRVRDNVLARGRRLVAQSPKVFRSRTTCRVVHVPVRHQNRSLGAAGPPW